MLAVFVVVGAGAAVVLAEPFGEGSAPPPVRAGGQTALEVVREGPVAQQINQSGTLTYAGRADGTPYSIVNQQRGIYTWVPSTGDTVKCGKIIYWAGDRPVPLLCASKPAYRDLAVGDEGRDVRDLNRNLVKLGYADKSELDSDSDYFGSETAEALENLQDDLGADETGTLRLGDAVFLPGPLRISKAMAKLGGAAMPGQQLAEATTLDRLVTVELDPAQQSQVKMGDRAQITLPDNSTTSGKVTRIGVVATGEDSGEQGSGAGSSSATVPIYIELAKPKDAGSLDQAPVQVEITTKGVDKALVVPVTALLGRSGGYAVEKVDAQGTSVLVPVTLGLFDNASGVVQVTGALRPGDRVVVPAT